VIFLRVLPRFIPTNSFRRDQQSINASYAMAIVSLAASGWTKGSVISRAEIYSGVSQRGK